MIRHGVAPKHRMRRVIGLSILLVGLLFAGLPAVVCAQGVPQGDCCPQGPGKPCRDIELIAAIEAHTTTCCTTSRERALADGVATPSIRAKAQAPADPLLLAGLALPMNPVVSSSGILHTSLVSFIPSGSALYLSTGRLRL